MVSGAGSEDSVSGGSMRSASPRKHTRSRSMLAVLFRGGAGRRPRGAPMAWLADAADARYSDSKTKG